MKLNGLLVAVRSASAILAVVFTLGAVGLLFIPTDAVFRISAQTEALRLEPVTPPARAFRLELARVFDANDALLTECPLEVETQAGAQLSLFRAGKEPLYLYVEPAQSGQQGWQLRCDNGQVFEGPDLSVSALPPAGGRQVLLLTGAASIGELPRFPGGEFFGLLEGEVQMISSGFLGGARSERKSSLDMGESIRLRNDLGEPSPGFVTIFLDEAPGMSVRHQARARAASVFRFGGDREEQRVLAPTWFERLEANVAWGLLPLLSWCLSSLLGLFGLSRE